MSTKKKVTPRKKSDVDGALAQLIKKEQDEIQQKREQFEAEYKPFVRKKRIANTESLVTTVHKIAEWSGVGEMTAQEVQQVSEFVATGQLFFEDNRLFYEIRTPVKRGDATIRKFEIREVPDSVFEGIGVDAFRIGMLQLTGRREEITKDEIRKIVGAAINMANESEVVGRIGTRDVLAIYGVYMLFFLGR